MTTDAAIGGRAITALLLVTAGFLIDTGFAATVFLLAGAAVFGSAVEKARAADAPRYRREGDDG